MWFKEPQSMFMLVIFDPHLDRAPQGSTRSVSKEVCEYDCTQSLGFESLIDYAMGASILHGVCHLGCKSIPIEHVVCFCKGIPLDYVVCFLVMWYIFLLITVKHHIIHWASIAHVHLCWPFLFERKIVYYAF